MPVSSVAAGPVITASNAAALKPVQRLGRGSVHALTWLPDGKTLALAGSIGLWLHSPGSEPTLVKTPFSVSAVDASPDGNLLAVGLSDGSVQLYDFRTNKLTASLYQYNARVLKVRFSPDGELLASSGGETPSARVIVLDMATAKAKWELTARSGADDLAFSPDGQMLAYQDIVGQLVLYNLGTGQVQSTLKEFGESTSVFAGIGSLAFSPRGDLIAVGKQDDGYVLIWDLKKEQIVAKLSIRLVGVYRKGILNVRFSPDGSHLIAGFEADQALYVWDVKTWQKQPSISGYHGSFALSPDGRRLAILTPENAVRIVDMETRTEVATLGGYRYSLFGASFPISVESQQVITRRSLSSMQVWDLASGSVQALESHVSLLTAVISPDGHWLMAGGADGTVYGWDTRSGAARQPIRVRGASKIIGLAFSHDGTRLAVGTNSNQVMIFSTSGDLMTPLQGTPPSPKTYDLLIDHLLIAFSPDDSRLLATGKAADGFVTQLWDSASGKRLNLWTSYGAAFSDDGQWLALVDKSGTIRLHNMAGKADRLIPTNLGLQDSPLDVTFSPDGTVLALLPQDYRIGTLSLWDTRQGLAIPSAPCKWTQTSISSMDYLKRLVAFSQDGSVLACASADDTRDIILWDVAHRKVLTLLREHNEFLADLSFSADGRFLVSGSADGVVYLWGLN